MNYVIYAVPFFLLAMLLEFCWGAWRRHNTYRINDTINSLSMGLIRNLSKVASLGVGAAVFSSIETQWALPAWDMSSPWTWIVGMLAYDLCYYWNHRIGHERQIFWASHVAHHQSEEYNLSTALRQTGTGFILSWIFYVPLFFLGMPVYVYVSVASLNLLYQFWVHTRFVPKLGWLEWIFITPSNHRVHHAQNPEYVDRNYGGLLIIWDRLFGTYQEERDDIDIVYGISTPLRSWNPVWANLHIYAHMLADSWHAAGWKDTCRVWWARTGWRPAGVSEQYPLPKSDLQDFHKFDPPLGNRAAWLLFTSFVLVTGIQLWFEAQVAGLAPEARWLGIGVLVYSLLVIGHALESGRFALVLELGRWAITSLALVYAQGAGASGSLLLAGRIVLVASAALNCLAIADSAGGRENEPACSGLDPVN